jgi:hypothetical protein
MLPATHCNGTTAGATMKPTLPLRTAAVFNTPAQSLLAHGNRPPSPDTLPAECSTGSLVKYTPPSSGFEDGIRKNLKRAAPDASENSEESKPKRSRHDTKTEAGLGTMDRLPLELKLKIFGHLQGHDTNASAKSIARLAPVNKTASALVQLTLYDHPDVGMVVTRKSINGLAAIHKKNNAAFRESIARLFEKNCDIAIDFSRLTKRQAGIVLDELSQQRHSHLRNLEMNFSGKSVPVENAKNALSRIGANNPDLRAFKLNLRRTGIDDDGVTEIAKVLRQSGVTHLDLSDNHEISSDGAAAIAEGLADSKLEHLDLSGNTIDDDGVTALAKALQSSRLTHLDLSANEFDDDEHNGVLTLVKALPESRLAYLGLRSSGLNDKTLDAIDQQLAESNLKCLELGGNDEFGEQALAVLQQRNAAVQILH